MKDKTKPTEFRSDKKTKSLRLAALAASFAVVGALGFAMVKSDAPTVAAHSYTSENKVAVVSSEQKDLSSETETAKSPALPAAKPANQTPVESSQSAAPAAAPAQTPAAVQQSAPDHGDTSIAQTAFEDFDEVDPDDVPAPTAVPVEQPAATNTTAQQDNVWHINYVPAWGADAAPDDGSIGIWADGWFIAHSGMVNGDKTASLPQYVEVDGQVYTMTDTWVSGDTVSTDEIARARANNGIVFQTCITDTTNRMVHYDPISGPGYAYNFSSYPYTVHDGEVFGY